LRLVAGEGTGSGTRVAMLLDVDGVLNPLVACNPLWCRCHRGWIKKRVLPDGEAYQVILNPRHGGKLLDLAADTGSELVWASYWVHHANAWIAPHVGLPDLPWVPIDAFPEQSQWADGTDLADLASTADGAKADEAELLDVTDGTDHTAIVSPGEWKALEVTRWSVAAGGRPFVWFEDEYDVPDALARLAGRHPIGPYLIVNVDPLTGLTDEHLAEARAWLSDREK
jgi:hypothetical protein